MGQTKGDFGDFGVRIAPMLTDISGRTASYISSKYFTGCILSQILLEPPLEGKISSYIFCLNSIDFLHKMGFQLHLGALLLKPKI